MSGANAGLTFGQSGPAVLKLVPRGRFIIYFDTGGIGLMTLNGTSPQGVFEFATSSAIASPTSFAAGSLIDGPNAANWTNSSSQTFWRIGPPYASPSFGAGSFLGFRFSTNNGKGWTETGTAPASRRCGTTRGWPRPVRSSSFARRTNRR